MSRAVAGRIRSPAIFSRVSKRGDAPSFSKRFLRRVRNTLKILRYVYAPVLNIPDFTHSVCEIEIKVNGETAKKIDGC